MSGISLQGKQVKQAALQAVLVSVDDMEGLEMTLEILGETDTARISKSLAALGRGQPGVHLATAPAGPGRHRAIGA